MAAMQQELTMQQELALDHGQSLEVQMRELFNSRWRRWHRAASYELAMEDAVTRQLLMLAVKHLPAVPGSRR